MKSLVECYAGKTEKLDIHCYEMVYEPLFEGRRLDVKSVLEVGVRFGGSLRAWAEYFPNAEIWGIDNGAEGGKVNWCDGRISCCYADEQKPETVQRFLTGEFFEEDWPNYNHSGKWDLVIDDGSHDPYVQAAMFAMAWPYVEPGGVFVCEDVEDISFAKKMADLFGGEVKDLRHVRGRHDSIMVIYRKPKE